MPHDQPYLLAEQKIQEALNSGATELDLSGMKLTELPSSIYQLTQLQKLDLGNGDYFGDEKNNQLSFLAESIGQLKELQSLDLSSNLLTNLPQSFGHLAKLRTLDISSNQLIDLPSCIERLTQLNNLNLFNNKLILLPEWLGQLRELRKLILSSNKLTSLPESLSHLVHLQEMAISFNQLSFVPEWLGRLVKLKGLDLSFNELMNLPESLGQLAELKSINVFGNQITKLPGTIGGLTHLNHLDIGGNQLSILPETFGELEQLATLNLSSNNFLILPECLIGLKNLIELKIYNNGLTELPDWINSISQLRWLHLGYGRDDAGEMLKYAYLGTQNRFYLINKISDLPHSLIKLEHLSLLSLDGNPLNPELAEAYEQGVDAVKLYLRAGAVVPSYEAKLIFVGEGEVGKTCLMDALLDKPWQEHPSTHGIEIQSFKVTYLAKKETSDLIEDTEESIDKDNLEKTQEEITLNGWDFGGQRVYRPTHQLFFSAPAVYLVVWKPREGPQQGFVKEWIQLIKRREPSAKIIVVATHGGPQQRQPDIDRQELWDLFGKETVVDFFFVDSKPDPFGQGNRKGIAELKEAIARVAVTLPEVGRSVPKSFADVRAALSGGLSVALAETTLAPHASAGETAVEGQATGAPYLPFDKVLAICRAHNMDDEIARLFITISHRLGHLTHYENDPALRDIVILRPDWLASAMSYVLDDEATRNAHGLVDFSRLNHLWDDPTRPADTRYLATLHRIFLRLMERFDLSYRVAGFSPHAESDPVSLIAQLVPDTTSTTEDFEKAWLPELAPGDIQQTQICRIVDAQNGQSANAEGLFFQLIVRLHKYSLGRVDYNDSVHRQKKQVSAISNITRPLSELG